MKHIFRSLFTHSASLTRSYSPHLKKPYQRIIRTMRKYPFIPAGLVVVACLLTAAVIERSLLEVRINQSLDESDSIIQKAREERLRSYNEFVDEQRKNAEGKTPSSTDQINSKMRDLSGKYNIHILFVAASQATIDAAQPLISTLTTQNAQSISSLSYVPTFISSFADVYNHDSYELKMLTYEKKTILLSPTMVGDIKQIWGKDPFGVSKLQDEFEKKAKETVIFLGKRDLVLFLYLDPDFSDSDPTNFYENKRFRSFANDELGRVYIDVYDISASFAPTVNEIVIHELLHQFGATDWYDEYSYSCSTKGFGEPNKDPLYPQKTADIMCGRVAEGKDDYRSASFENNEIVINEHTAKNLGWEKKE